MHQTNSVRFPYQAAELLPRHWHQLSLPHHLLQPSLQEQPCVLVAMPKDLSSDRLKHKIMKNSVLTSVSTINLPEWNSMHVENDGIAECKLVENISHTHTVRRHARHGSGSRDRKYHAGLRLGL